MANRLSDRLRRWCTRGEKPPDNPGPGFFDWVFVGRTVELKDGRRMPLFGWWIKAWRN